MRSAFAWLLAALLGCSGVWIVLNPDTVEEWILQQTTVTSAPNHELLGLQEDERWLVAIVTFSDAVQGPDDVGFAQQLLGDSASDYVQELSGGSSTVNVHVHPRVVMAPDPLSTYGGDINGRDTGSNGVFSPLALARHVAEQLEEDVNWSDYDLNGDKRVDRFMVLHTSIGQEESPDDTDRIWSHFTHFESPIALPNGFQLGHYTMSSLKTGSSGVGTILHETMHQMGALDLYAVENDQSYRSWKGVGDWDIMGSGNWNGGGRWPAMPTGATLDLIAANQTQPVVLEWPLTNAAPCLGPTIDLTPISDGGKVLKIPLTDRESVYVELRNDSGFDSRLPGHGVLVTQLDRTAGNEAQNTVNTNPDRPYLKVIEADGGNELLRGINSGEESDLFLNGTMFGAQGVEIRNHDGVLVSWMGKVTVTNGSFSINFRAEGCTPHFTLDLPDHGGTLLRDEALPIELLGATECTSNLTSTDGRGVLINLDRQELRFSSAGVANSAFHISGTITCDERTVHVHHEVQLMSRIPTPADHEGVISPTSDGTIEVALPSRGNGEQRLEVHLDGPLSRVASAPNNVVLDGNSTLLVTITPNGLLSENMLVRGQIQLETEDGAMWAYNVELLASSSDTWWQDAMTPGRVVGIALIVLAGYWFLAGMSQTTASVSKPTTNSEPHPEPEGPMVAASELTVPLPQVDPWGRPLDD